MAKKQTESGLIESAQIQSAPIGDQTSKIGIPVKYKADKRKPHVIDKKAVLTEKFSELELEMETLKEQRNGEGENAINSPVVFFAQVVKDARNSGIKNGYAVRIGALRAKGGQGHITAIKRLQDLGHMIVGHDLPSVADFKKMKEESGAVDIDASIKRFRELLEFVEDEIDISFSRKESQVVKVENQELKDKIKELQEQIKSKEANNPPAS